MKIAKSFHDLPSNTAFALSIGVFDGVHLGHLAIIQALKKTGAPTLILTFTNHPAEILRPESIPSTITTIEEKLSLFEECGIDVVLLIPFTKKLAETSFENLLDQMKLSHIVLGEGDGFGKNREGSKEALLEYGKRKNIEIITVTKNECSSSAIRKLIAANELEQASKLLGRPYNKK